MDDAPVFAIDGLRAAIDDIDDQLIALLNQRAETALEIGRLKSLGQSENTEFHVAAREHSIIERLERASGGPFPATSIKPIFNEIFKACLSLQK